jgi:hypothetical protein
VHGYLECNVQKRFIAPENISFWIGMEYFNGNIFVNCWVLVGYKGGLK